MFSFSKRSSIKLRELLAGMWSPMLHFFMAFFMALFIAFLLIFKHAQDHINTLTQRHLDFYFKDVLKLKAKSAVPDQVHLIFKAAKNISSHKFESNFKR